MSTLAPKSTSKKTKSRHVVFPGMPYQRLTRSQYLDPLYNHKLQANKEISRRERHFRMILAQAMCASHPQNPDLTEFMPPYWLKCTNVHHQRAQLPGLDPLIQSTAHTRLVRATIARTDVQKKSQWIHRGLITENDIQQVESMIERAKSLPIPKLDRVLNRCEELISKCQQEELSLLLGEAYGVDGSLAENSESVEIPLQHRLTRDDVSSILGSPVHDAGRAILRQDEEIQLDEQRLQVERIIGLSTANSEQIYKYKLYQVMHAFQLHPTDVGSPQVQGNYFDYQVFKLTSS